MDQNLLQGELIKNARENAGYTQGELAELLGTSTSYVSKIETGKKRITVEDVAKLDELFGGALTLLMVNGSRNQVNSFNNNTVLNTSLIAKFDYILKNYLVEKKNEFKENALGNELRSIIPVLTENILFLNKEWRVWGSVGQGKWSDIPWLCISLKEVTVKAQEGIYVVALFRTDMSGFYLTINQGWTWFRDSFGKKEGLNKIRLVAGRLRLLIPNANKYTATIALKGKKNSDLATGYEAGNIIAKYYDASSLPSESEFINDLTTFVKTYNNLIDIVGTNYEQVLSFDELEEIDQPVEDGICDGETQSTKERKGGRRRVSSKENHLRKKALMEENKEVGTNAERFVFESEKKHLAINGRPDLADRVRWISNPEDGIDGECDIQSFYIDGKEKFIEVKGTRQEVSNKFKFYISRNEVEYAIDKSEQYELVLVDNVPLEISEQQPRIRRCINNAFKDFVVEENVTSTGVNVRVDKYFCTFNLEK